MRKITFSKEIILILIPFFFTTFITSISNWYEFNEKTKNLYIKSINKLSDDNFELEIQTDIVKFQNKIIREISLRNKSLNKLYSNNFQNNKFTKFTIDSINTNLISVSKQIGKVESISELLKNKWNYSKILLELLKSKQDLLFAIKNNSLNKDNLYFEYIKHHSKFQENNSLLIKKIKDLKKKDSFEFKHVDENTNNYKWISWLNLLLSFICFISLSYLIYYSIDKRIFK